MELSCLDTARPPPAQVADPHTGAQLDDVRLVNEITILFFAGFETSGHAQAWMLCAPNLVDAYSVVGYYDQPSLESHHSLLRPCTYQEAPPFQASSRLFTHLALVLWTCSAIKQLAAKSAGLP